MHTPGVKVVFPSTPSDAKGLLASCVFDDDPCLFIEHVGLHYSQKEQVPAGEHRVPLGEAAVRRPGDDVTVASYGAQMPGVMAAAQTLAGEGISVEVIDLRSLVPLDFPTVLASVARTRRAVVVHGATRFAGPGAEIAATVTEELFEDLAQPVVRLGARFVPTPFLASGLEALPVADDVVEAVRRLASS
jgi:pyruvate/2-oxoglutarate/acetoin dehydrogenase E1 component